MPPDADGDLRLSHLIADSVRVALGVENGQDPFLLEVLEHGVPADDADQNGRPPRDRSTPSAADRPATGPRRPPGDRSGSTPRSGSSATRPAAAPTRATTTIASFAESLSTAPAAEPCRDHQNRRHPGELARLDGQRTEGEPTASAAADLTEKRTPTRAANPTTIDHRREASVEIETNAGKGEQGQHAGAGPEQLSGQQLGSDDVRKPHSGSPTTLRECRRRRESTRRRCGVPWADSTPSWPWSGCASPLSPRAAAKIVAAVGAAMLPPPPPCSTTTAMTICGSSTGAQPTNHAWCWRCGARSSESTPSWSSGPPERCRSFPRPVSAAMDRAVP